jgi:hypothetical protein
LASKTVNIVSPKDLQMSLWGGAIQPGFPIWPSGTRKSYASSALSTTKFSPEQAPARPRGSDGSFLPSDEPRLLTRNRVLRHRSDPFPSTPDFATAIGVLPARHRQRPDPPEHRPEQASMQMPLGQQQPVVTGMLDQSPARLHEPLLQAGQRPGIDSLRQHDSRTFSPHSNPHKHR